jgi:peptidoglycan hydrolase-like protein with peptidoglycan-binding domain
MARRGAAAIAALAVLVVPATADAKYAGRTLKSGSHGNDVKQLQRYLTRAGFRTTADGHYGTGTVRAEQRFERAADRRADGRATPSDQRLARSAAASGTTHGTSNGGARYEAPAANETAKAVLGPDGRTAVAPATAPQQVKDAIAAANAITTKPYRYGGGHGSFKDSAYDCSGSVSYAMHGAGLLDQPLDSNGFARWGQAGKGQWITTYGNSSHAFVIIAGLRFDTSGRGESGPRWRPEARSTSGFVARHPAGL